MGKDRLALLFRMSTLSLGTLNRQPLSFSGATPVESLRRDFM